ncbi:MAG TPA: sodium:proton antiporter [Candidatus Limnocylindria bacterium]|jgi:CPA1 family monovalent cation:H+ antiporter
MTPGAPIRPTEVFIILIAVSTVVALATRRTRFLPYSVALVVLGLVVSVLDLPVDLQVDPAILLSVFLPGLVFEAAYRTDLRLLWRSAGAVAFLAVPGVLLSAAIVAVVLNAVTQIGLVACFVVGAVLAATDPAAVLAVVSKLHVPRQLTTLIEAESLFNDGTGVVLFALAVGALRAPVEGWQVIIGLGVVTFVSAAIGVVVGFIGSRALTRADDHLIELMISVVVAYGSYLLADRLGESGLIASVVAGLVFGSYGKEMGASRAGSVAMDTVWEFAAYLLTTFVFLLVGLAIGIDQVVAALLPALAVFAALLVGRALIVYGLLGIGDRILSRRANRQPFASRWLHLIAWSGLRGAVATALALALPADVPHRGMLQGIIFACVLLTLLLQGTTVDFLVSRLGLDRDDDREQARGHAKGRDPIGTPASGEGS